METLIPILLTGLQSVLPFVTKTEGVSKIVNTLLAALPTLLKLGSDEYSIVKEIINDLKGNRHVTPEDMAKLKVMDRQIDDALDQAFRDKGV